MADDGKPLAGAGELIRPPLLEEAGLEDCALPPESIAEAFSLAAKAVSSRLLHLPLSDDDEGDQCNNLPPHGGAGGCVEDAGPTRGAIPDVLLGVEGDGDGRADEVVIVGGGGAGGSGDDLVVGGDGGEEDRVFVIGEGEVGEEKACIVGTGDGAEKLGHKDNGEEGKEEKAILLEDFL